MAHVDHKIPPVFDSRSTILILGSFPSVKSREGQFFYHHPQNRFWRVLSAVFDCQTPSAVEEKKVFLLSHGIALWDVIASCEIHGSSDSSIKNAVPNQLSLIFSAAPIREIFTNGATASRLYEKHCLPSTKRPATKLPSTSPANASYSLERLIEAWSVIVKNNYN